MINIEARGTVACNEALLRDADRYLAPRSFNNKLDLGGKTLTKTGEGTLAVNNILTSGGGTLNCSEGFCSGSGTIGGDVKNDGGTISSGNSPGTMTIEGDYAQSDEGTLEIAWKRPRPLFTEAAFLALSDTHILAAARVNGDHVHSVTGDIPPMGLGTHNAEINQKSAFIESWDGGLSWSKEKFVLEFSDVQAKFLKLADGRLLCSYRCRSRLPYGVIAILSEDDGKTWDLQHRIVLGMHSDLFGTWQHDIQLPDGSMRTCWAWMGDGSLNFEVVHWELPAP